MVIFRMEGWEEMESKEVKEKGKNKQTSRKQQETNTKNVWKIYIGRDSVLINSKLNRH
jgi:hypothetical protein